MEKFIIKIRSGKTRASLSGSITRKPGSTSVVVSFKLKSGKLDKAVFRSAAWKTKTANINKGKEQSTSFKLSGKSKKEMEQKLAGLFSAATTVTVTISQTKTKAVVKKAAPKKKSAKKVVKKTAKKKPAPKKTAAKKPVKKAGAKKTSPRTAANKGKAKKTTAKKKVAPKNSSYDPPSIGDNKVRRKPVVKKAARPLKKAAPKKAMQTTRSKPPVYEFPLEETVYLKKIVPETEMMKAVNEEGEEESYKKYKVYYGTNRARTGEPEPEDFYSGDRSRLELGVCMVSIPPKHKEGVVERPGWFKSFFISPSPEKHMVLLSVEPMEANDVYGLIQYDLVNENDAFLFVHGYNVSFEESMLKTAQLGYDLNLKCPAIGYSWPSRGKVAGYFGDEGNVEASLPDFKKFLLDLLQNTGIEKLNIIAHSMGNRLVCRALEQLSLQHSPALSTINQIILAAPDIDAEVFRTQIAPAFNFGKRVTLYASSNDKALMASEHIRSGYPRAGQAGDDLCVIPPVETIDASLVSTDLLGHGYFASTKALIDDIFYIIKHNHSPGERKLVSRLKGTLQYWEFSRT